MIKQHIFLTDDVVTTDNIMLRYVNYILEGFTLQSIMIENSTIKGYTRAVNNYYYTHHHLPHPWDLESQLKAVELRNHQISFEENPDKREPLHDRVLTHMMYLSGVGHSLKFRKAIWLWTKLGC